MFINPIKIQVLYLAVYVLLPNLSYHNLFNSLRKIDLLKFVSIFDYEKLRLYRYGIYQQIHLGCSSSGEMSKFKEVNLFSERV